MKKILFTSAGIVALIIAVASEAKAAPPSEEVGDGIELVNSDVSYKVMYRYRPTDDWGIYGTFASSRDAETEANQLASVGWLVEVVPVDESEPSEPQAP